MLLFPNSTGSSISPDGSSITGGTGSLVTAYGVWTFGPPSHGAGDDVQNFYRVMLNGKEFGDALDYASQLRVANGGQLYALSFDFNEFQIQGYSASGYTPSPLPNFNPPYMPSPDGSILTGTTGSLTTLDGVWTIDSNGYTILNGTRSAHNYFITAMLQVDAHGTLFSKDTGGNWLYWAAFRWNDTTGPVVAPVPISISFSTYIPTLPHTSPVGTNVAAIAVTMSDGSAFSGALTASVDGGGQQTMGLSGSEIVTAVSPLPTGALTGTFITATQNGATFGMGLDVGVS
jgi:hypothetical protein